MAKFQALYAKSLNISFVLKDENGNILRDETIQFNKGLNTNKGFVPANYSTDDPDRIEFLRKNPSNVANGGQSYMEILDKPVQTKAPVVAKEPEAPVVPAEEVEETAPEEVENTSLEEEVEETAPEAKPVEEKVYEEVTTVNAASEILRDLFPELRVRDVNTTAKIKEVAASKKISFPNL